MTSREIFGGLIASALVAAVLSSYVPRNGLITGAARVIDGDSLHVGDTVVHLFGVDAFEGEQICLRNGQPWRCGEAAAHELRKLTDARALYCTRKGAAAAGRTTAVCNNGTVNLGAELTRAGLALADREVSADYVKEENAARNARRGAWAADFTAPWIERRRGGESRELGAALR
jgi:endonuclease YncB( thermonuclease family)